MIRARRAMKARRTKGRCPICRTVMVTGAYIVLLPGTGWAHSKCAADKNRSTNPIHEGERPVKTATAAPPRAARCRYHNRLGDPCSNPVIDEDSNAIQLCPSHALRAAQLLVEKGAIAITYATPDRRRTL